MKITYNWHICQNGTNNVDVSDLGYDIHQWLNLSSDEQGKVLQKYLDDTIDTIELSPYIITFNW